MSRPSLSLKEFQDFILLLLEPRNKELRIGQHASNQLSIRHSIIYVYMVYYHKRLDPYYDNSRMEEFIKFLASLIKLQ